MAWIAGPRPVGRSAIQLRRQAMTRCECPRHGRRRVGRTPSLYRGLVRERRLDRAVRYGQVGRPVDFKSADDSAADRSERESAAGSAAGRLRTRRRRAIQRGAVRTGKPARQRVKAPKSDDVWEGCRRCPGDLVVEAVDRQPVSALNSLLSGKRTGKTRKTDTFGQVRRPETPVISKVYPSNSLFNGTGNEIAPAGISFGAIRVCDYENCRCLLWSRLDGPPTRGSDRLGLGRIAD